MQVFRMCSVWSVVRTCALTVCNVCGNVSIADMLSYACSCSLSFPLYPVPQWVSVWIHPLFKLSWWNLLIAVLFFKGRHVLSELSSSQWVFYPQLFLYFFLSAQVDSWVVLLFPEWLQGSWLALSMCCSKSVAWVHLGGAAGRGLRWDKSGRRK